MFLTVFTPTYNRASTLFRVFNSLKKQQMRDFEWLIVDDGSTDATRALIDSWVNQVEFPIRYVFQANQGKHIAMNCGITKARGDFFIIADSDDAFDPDSFDFLKHTWESIPEAEKNKYTGVTARCRTQNGEFVGTHLPKPILDSDTLELQFRYKVSGEKWGMNKTEVLRLFPLEETPEMGSFPWGLIAYKGYKTRYSDRVIRTYYVDEGPGSMSKSLTVKKPFINVRRNRDTLNWGWSYFIYDPLEFFKIAINLARFGKAAGLNFFALKNELKKRGARFLLLLAYPLAVFFPVKTKE